MTSTLEEFHRTANASASDGTVVPALVAGLIHAARHIAREHSIATGEGFFEACIAEILAGGDGLHAGTNGKA